MDIGHLERTWPCNKDVTVWHISCMRLDYDKTSRAQQDNYEYLRRVLQTFIVSRICLELVHSFHFIQCMILRRQSAHMYIFCDSSSFKKEMGCTAVKVSLTVRLLCVLLSYGVFDISECCRLHIEALEVQEIDYDLYASCQHKVLFCFF